MFDNKLSFFENKSRRSEYDKKLRKLKNHFKPDVLYKLEVPPHTACQQRSCPLELKPSKLSETSLEYYREKETSKSKRKSKKSKTKYNCENSNQQSVDDSILTGLQTVIDLCGLLEECDNENKRKLERQQDKKKIRNKKLSCSISLLTKNKSQQCGDKLNSSSSSHESNSLHESRDSNKAAKPPSEPSSFRKLLIKASRSCIINKSPFKSSGVLSVPDQNMTQTQTSSQYANTLDTLNTAHITHETVCSQTQSSEHPREYMQVYACCKSAKKNKKSMKPIEEEPQIVKIPSCCILPEEPVITKKPCGTPDSPCRARATPADENIIVSSSRQSLRRRSNEDDIDQYWSKRNQMAQNEYTSKSREIVRTSSKASKRSSLQSITEERPSKVDSFTGLVKDKTAAQEYPASRTSRISKTPESSVIKERTITQEYPASRTSRISKTPESRVIEERTISHEYPASRTSRISKAPESRIIEERSITQEYPASTTFRISEPSESTVIEERTISHEYPASRTSRISKAPESRVIEERSFTQEYPASTTFRISEPSESRVIEERTISHEYPASRTSRIYEPSETRVIEERTITQEYPASRTSRISEPSETKIIEERTITQEYPTSRTTRILEEPETRVIEERTIAEEYSETGIYKTPEGSRTRSTSLSAKYFPPLEIGPSNVYSSTARTPLSQRTFTREDSYVVPPEYTNYNEPSYIQAEPYEPIPNRRTVIYDPSLLCNKDITIPLEKNQVEIKKGRPGLPLVQPVLGFCSSAKCGREHLKSIKYALVKISEFIGFSTYEIMKPYKEKPKNVPTCIAEIFVTSPVKKREDSYIVTRAVSLQKQISEDHSPCVPETSDYVRARSNHIRESSGHVREPSSHVREPSSHVREPSSHFRQPSSHIREPSSHIRGPSSHIRQPSSHIRQPSSHIREPSVHIREPSSHIREPSSHIREPSSHIREPSSHIREPSSHIREPSSHFREPSSHIREPSSQIREPSSHVRQPSSHIREPSSHIREPSSHVREPSFSIREPSSHVREPSYTIREPSSHIRHPSSHIREPSSHIREPSSHIREPSSHVREPSCSIREPSSHVCEASSSIREPSCPIREPSSHVRELSSHIRESISSFREPSDLIREPSCPIRELSSHDPDPSSYVRESSGRIRVPSGYVHESSRIRQDDSLRIIRSTEPLAQSNFGVSSQCKTPLSQQSVQLSHTTQKISASKPLLASYTGVEACVCEQDHVQPIVTQTTLQESVVYQDPHSREFSTVGSKQPSRQVSIVHEEPPSCSRCVTMDVKEETSQQPICSRELSTVASRQPSRQVSIIHKEVPSCCRGVVMDVKEETSQHPIYSEELSTVVSLQPIDTEPSYVQHTSSCECFGRQSQISTPRETSEQLARLSQSQQKESFTQAHSGNTSIVISTEPRMPSCCRQELTESQMQPTLEGSNLPTESVQYKRSTLRTTESGRIYNKSTHFQEH